MTIYKSGKVSDLLKVRDFVSARARAAAFPNVGISLQSQFPFVVLVFQSIMQEINNPLFEMI